MNEPKFDAVKSMFDFYVLRKLCVEPADEFQLAGQLSDGALKGLGGSMTTAIRGALERMENVGWVEVQWREMEDPRRAKVYSPTPAGLERLEAESGSQATEAARFNEGGLDGSFGEFLGRK